MTLTEKIKADIASAMKAKNAELLETLRLVDSEITKANKATGTPLTEPQVLDLLIKERKKRLDNVEFYNSKNIPAGAAKEQAEADIISAYLPQDADIEEISEYLGILMTDVYPNATIKDMGKIMNDVVEFFKSDNKIVNKQEVSALVKNLL